MLMHKTYAFTLMLFAAGQSAAQEAASRPAATTAVQPVFRVLSNSTVQQRDGSSITFLEVVPPDITTQAAPLPLAPATPLTAAQEAALSQSPVHEPKILGISASVHASGLTVLRWTCDGSLPLQAVANVDFRDLEGVGSFETPEASYMLLLSAGPDEQALTDAQARAAKALPVNGTAAIALVSGSTPASPADQAALDAMEALLDFFDTHRQELSQLREKRKTERAARELAAGTAPPPPPRHSVVHF